MNGGDVGYLTFDWPGGRGSPDLTPGGRGYDPFICHVTPSGGFTREVAVIVDEERLDERGEMPLDARLEAEQMIAELWRQRPGNPPRDIHLSRTP